MDVQIITKMFNAKYENPVVEYFKNLRFRDRFELCQKANWSIKRLYMEVLKLMWEEDIEYNQ